MKLKAKHNLADVLDALDQLESDIQNVAMVRTLNTLAGQADVAGRRKIREIYGISTADLAPYFSVELASLGRLEARIVAKGKGFPLRLFHPRQGPRGVTVTIKGRSILIPHGFINRGAGLAGQVMARGRYNAGTAQAARRRRGRRKAGLTAPPGGSVFRSSGEAFGAFAFGLGRFPIALLRTSSPPDALSNPEVTDAMNTRIEEQAAKVLAREIKAAARGF